MVDEEECDDDGSTISEDECSSFCGISDKFVFSMCH